ncbi:cytochrome c oxidase assembly factor Coa1 family protein [Aquimarina sp. 2201CG14-23]|uniref:cytochrome c oxidase assembly factor Coa1 family protein n=1 Tax=Aquimarina mycalae TaxID=3040073 RepID=UPI002477E238|nr:cytochrome c oxidase assembly factor Coa1 family protein [Aquimarina sp. 2201CG14-23]MDH7446146.1 cytochrome c oxidase assembly factor Coa1 family protein [Aquimarina sp. 2201CG14-23]
MDQLKQEKSWWKKNRNWVLTICVLMIGFFITVIMFLGKPIGDFTKAIIDRSVYDNAFDIVNEDKRVIEALGTLKPIGFFEVLEGEVHYSEDNSKAFITVRVLGSKQKGKMDIVASRKNEIWKYERIRIRTKKPKKTIEILDGK